MEIDIQAQHLSLVRSILAAHAPNRRAWAFGSRVLGKARPYSDLDLALEGNTPLGLHEQAALSEAFSDSDLPFKVDVLDWTRASASFKGLIAGHRVLIHEPDMETSR